MKIGSTKPRRLREFSIREQPRARLDLQLSLAPGSSTRAELRLVGQKHPVQVTFEPARGEKSSFVSRAIDQAGAKRRAIEKGEGP